MAILLSLFQGIWAIDADAVEAYRPLINAIIKNPHEDFSHLMPKARVFDYTAISAAAETPIASPMTWNGGLGAAKKGSIAVLPIAGPIMKNDFCGSAGTATMCNWLSQVEKNPNIIGSILLTDSPGGNVDGPPVLADHINTCSKPVLAYVDGMCASAAYWICSAADHIMASHPINTIGSIGVMRTMKDYRANDEKRGVKTQMIYASTSPDKNKDYHDAMDGNTAMVQKRLDEMHALFKGAVSKNRWNAGLDKSTLTGHTYLANEAKDKGLIDSIGSMSAAFNKVTQLSKS